MSTVAVVDIGSNSVCLLVARRGADGTVTVLDKLKDTPRLRDEIDEHGVLSEVGAARTLAALRLFAQVIGQHKARVRVVATAALRAACNAQDFIARAQRETGLRVEIVSGDEEARLAFLGALSGLGELDGETMVADVGGGSTELVLGLDGRAVQTMSEPLGALTVTRDWLGPDPVSLAAVAHARAQIRAMLAPVVGAFRGRPQLRAVATSGTIQRVARIACRRATRAWTCTGWSWARWRCGKSFRRCKPLRTSRIVCAFPGWIPAERISCWVARSSTRR